MGLVQIDTFSYIKYLSDTYYMHLKIKNMCLKIYVKIRVNKKIYKNVCNIV